MEQPSKRYRIDPATKSLYKGDTKLLNYSSYEQTGSTVKFIIAPASVEVMADNVTGLNTETYLTETKAPAKRAPKSKS